MALKTSASLSWTLGLALICVSGLMIFSFIVIFPRFKMMQGKLDRINLVMKERLSGTLVVRAFRTEKHEEKRFDFANRDLTQLYIFVNKALAFMTVSYTHLDVYKRQEYTNTTGRKPDFFLQSTLKLQWITTT